MTYTCNDNKKNFHETYITKLCLTCHIYFALAITSHLDKDGYPPFPISH